MSETCPLRNLTVAMDQNLKRKFPSERAAEIAVRTVQEYKQETASKIKVIFNVFNKQDYEIYARLLGANK